MKGVEIWILHVQRAQSIDVTMELRTCYDLLARKEELGWYPPTRKKSTTTNVTKKSHCPAIIIIGWLKRVLRNTKPQDTKKRIISMLEISRLLAYSMRNAHVRLAPQHISQVIKQTSSIKKQALSEATSELHFFTVKPKTLLFMQKSRSSLWCTCRSDKALVYWASCLFVDSWFLSMQAISFRYFRDLPATWVSWNTWMYWSHNTPRMSSRGCVSSCGNSTYQRFAICACNFRLRRGIHHCWFMPIRFTRCPLTQ